MKKLVTLCALTALLLVAPVFGCQEQRQPEKPPSLAIMVESLRNEVRKMEKATGELREMLNPVKLRPMILRTRCELCPA